MYNLSGDVLGVLIGRVAGQTLGQFLRERIFEPLGMVDTGFFVPEEKVSRFTPCYVSGGVFDDVEGSAWRGEPPFESGGGGLVGTVDDYFAFCRMMLNKGRLGRERIISPASVELMTSDQVNASERAGPELFFGSHSSWGLGIAVDIGRSEIFHSPGRFGWTGRLGTIAYTDPANGVIAVLSTVNGRGSDSVRGDRASKVCPPVMLRETA